MEHLLLLHTESARNESVNVKKTASRTANATVTFPSRIVMSVGILHVTAFIMDMTCICLSIHREAYLYFRIPPVHQNMIPMDFYMLFSE